MLFARPTGGAGKLSAEEPAAQDMMASRDCPALIAWLTERRWEDGTKRETGTVMVLAEDGVWKAWLHDRDGKRSCWVSSGALFDLLIRVDEMLKTGAGDWRPDRTKGRG
jgi:hypothetical protein